MFRMFYVISVYTFVVGFHPPFKMRAAPWKMPPKTIDTPAKIIRPTKLSLWLSLIAPSIGSPVKAPRAIAKQNPPIFNPISSILPSAKLTTHGAPRLTKPPLQKPYSNANTMIPGNDGENSSGSQKARQRTPLRSETVVMTLN